MFFQTEQGFLFKIKVIPKASYNEIVEIENDELKIRLAAVHDRGEAHDELVRFLAKLLQIEKTHVKIIRGQTSRHKQVEVTGIDTDPMAEYSNYDPSLADKRRSQFDHKKPLRI